MSTYSSVRIPPDGSNTGQRVHVIERDVGGLPMVEHVVVPTDGRDISGVYYGFSGLLTIQQSAHSADEGFVYIINPSTSTKNVSLRRIAYQGAPTTTSARPTTIITAERFSHTGTFSGVSITTGKRDITNPNPSAVIATNSAGLSISMSGATQRGFLIPAVPSGNNSTGSSNELVWEPLNIEGETIVRPSEGILFRQASDGASGDDRSFLLNITWAEYTE